MKYDKLCDLDNACTLNTKDNNACGFVFLVTIY